MMVDVYLHGQFYILCLNSKKNEKLHQEIR